jgi:hypothetical protein
MTSKYKDGDLQVWWIPQVPMKAFEFDVPTIEAGVMIMDALAEYDMFQFDNNVKPDYCNAGGIRRWCSNSDGEGTPGWEDWYDHETGEDNPRLFLAETQHCGVRP